ncbi:TonB-dependent receptor [Sunxiuqinia sp. A32]|uniref:TonB-dependent receptor n=1 Tax=Sunxiuqinia sp. A32 TaxID=3461496 RepID=UPI00404601F7
MKLVIILTCIIGLTGSYASVYSQKAKLNLNVQNMTVKNVLKLIEDQSEYTFMYNATKIDVYREVDLNVEESNIEDILEKIFGRENVSYTIINRHIIISSGMNDFMQQEKSISGKVSDSSGSPLPGVTVVMKGTTQGTITNEDGIYFLSNVRSDDVLIFSFVGMKTQEIPVGDQTKINVKLVEETVGIEEVVAIGYGTVKKSDLTGAVGSIRGDKLPILGESSVSKALQGVLAGVQVESAGGDPGTGMRVLIRGVGTWNNNDPLYVLDGVQVANIDNINSSDIASISVLKDASAAAIYGSRAANGVVLVTTKSGTAGKTSMGVNAYFGVQQLPHKMDVLNAEEFAQVDNAAHDAAGVPRLDFLKEPGSNGVGTDWQDEIYRIAPIQNYDLSVSGGGKESNYSVSFGYLRQEGIVKETNYSRYNLRVKSQTTLGRLTIGETVLVSNENRKLILSGWGGLGGNAVGAALHMIPNFDIYDSNAIGGYAGAYGQVSNVENPVALLNLKDPKSQTTDIMVNAYAQVDLISGLFYKLNLGYTNSLVADYLYTKRYQVGQFFTNPTNNLTEGSSRNPFMMAENTLNYEKTFGKHNIRGLAGYTMQKNQYRNISATAQGLPDGIAVLDAGQGTKYNGGSETENTLVSEFGRIDYTYDQRYMLTVNFRRDGSSRFSQKYRYGNFSSVAVAWNIAKEQFFSTLVSKVSSLKLRGSYGKLGNQLIPDYVYIPVIRLNQNWVAGTDQHLWPGAIQTDLAAPDIQWESTKTFDIGLDLSVFNNKINLTADYYNKETSGILVGMPIPGSVGANNEPTVNAGNIRNRGLELALSYAGGHEFRYNINGTLSINRNRVLSLAGGRPLHGPVNITKEGGPVGAFYLIKTDGIFNSEQEVQSHNKDGNLIQPNAAPGDIRYVDANGDGMISSADQVYCGDPSPKFSGGIGFNISWKGFDLSAFMQGTYGNKIYNGIGRNQMVLYVGNEGNVLSSLLDSWTPDHHTNIPRLILTDPNNNSRYSDRFLEDGSYLRMKTMQLGYTFNSNMIKPVGFSSLRVYVSSDNVFTITNYSGYNPDIGRGGSVLNRGVDFESVAYPLARTIALGVQLGL